MDDFRNGGFYMDFDAGASYPDQLKAALVDATVMSIFFMRVGQSMILDFRSVEGVDPAVMIDGMSVTPRDRLLSFQRLRPQLPIPEEITLAPWTERVQEFEREGVFDRLLARCDEVGGGVLMDEGRRAYLKILAEERKLLRELVSGAGMETIWELR